MVRPWRISRWRFIVHFVMPAPLWSPFNSFTVWQNTTPVSIISRVIKRIILRLEKPVRFTCGKFPVHTSGVVQHKHDICRCRRNLGIQRGIGNINTLYLWTLTCPVTVVAVFIHTIVADFSGSRMNGSISVIAVAHVNWISVTIKVQIIACARRVGTVAVLVNPIVADFSGSRMDAGIIIIAVVTGMQRVNGRQIAVSVIINIAGCIKAVTILIYGVATDFSSIWMDSRIIVVTVPSIWCVSVSIIIYIIRIYGRDKKGGNGLLCIHCDSCVWIARVRNIAGPVIKRPVGCRNCGDINNITLVINMDTGRRGHRSSTWNGHMKIKSDFHKFRCNGFVTNHRNCC